MPLYSKPSKDLVYDLINEANPDLDIPITPTNAVVGLPTALPSTIPWPQSNTTIVVSAAPGNNDYVGKQTLNYRRLDLDALFRSMVVTIRKYRDVSGLSSGSTVYTAYQLLPAINELYGLNLTEDDVSNIGISRGTALENGYNTNTVTVQVKATSLGYVGSFKLKWVNAPRSLTDMITIKEIPGRLFPGGNDFTGAHPDILTPMGFGIDFSQAMNGNNYTGANISERAMNSPYWGTDAAAIQAIFALINAKCGTDYKFTSGGLAETPGEFWQGRWTVQSSNNASMNAAYPEINSADFNKVIIIKPPADQTWAVDALILGFNYP